MRSQPYDAAVRSFGHCRGLPVRPRAEAGYELAGIELSGFDTISANSANRQSPSTFDSVAGVPNAKREIGEAIQLLSPLLSCGVGRERPRFARAFSCSNSVAAAACPAAGFRCGTSPSNHQDSLNPRSVCILCKDFRIGDQLIEAGERIPQSEDGWTTGAATAVWNVLRIRSRRLLGSGNLHMSAHNLPRLGWAPRCLDLLRCLVMTAHGAATCGVCLRPLQLTIAS